MWKKLFDWLDERLGLNDAYKNLLDRPEPKGNWWNTLGSASLFLFILQGATGIFLTVYYTPSPDHAYDSVQYIMEGVAFGWLIRGIHHWGASLMVLIVFIHMLRVFVTASYKYPRELTWVSGVMLLLLTLGFGFTGYLLPWNEVSFFATRVGTDIAATVPVLGEGIVRFLRGGSDVSGATLTRLFGFHGAILPAIATALVALHLLLVQRHGMSVPPSVERRIAIEPDAVRSMPFLPHFLLRDLLAWTAVLAVLSALATLYPWEIGAKADPFAPGRPTGHEGGLRGRRGTVVMRCRHDVHVDELGDQRLVLVDRLERALTDLGLVWRVGRVPLPSQQQLVDRRGRPVAVHAGSQERHEVGPVATGQLTQSRGELELGLGRGQVQRRRAELRRDVREELVDAVDAERRQHPLAVGRGMRAVWHRPVSPRRRGRRTRGRRGGRRSPMRR